MVFEVKKRPEGKIMNHLRKQRIVHSPGPLLTPDSCLLTPFLICFLLFFLFSCVFFPASIKAFPYQAGWPKTISGDIYSSPVVADLDQDGHQEVIFTTFNPFSVYVLKYNGTTFNRAWPKVFSNSGGSAVSVADLDNDGDLEIVAIGQYLYAWHYTGEYVNGFPADSDSAYFWAAPAIGDLTGDDVPEIADGNYECEFYVWDNQGNVLSGFPKTYSYPAKGSCTVMFTPAIGDIDLDGINEVIVPVDNYHVYAYNANGSIVSGIWDFSPDYGNISSDITLGDIDNDGILEVLFIARPIEGGYYPEILNHDTSSVVGWPPIDLNNRTTGGLVISDIDNDGKLEVVTGTYWNTGSPLSVYVFEGESGQVKNGWPVVLPDYCGFMRNMILGDVNGDGSVDILGFAMCGSSDGKIFAWDQNGNSLSGFPFSISGYGPNFSTGFICDIDHDGDVEIGVCGTDTYAHSKVYIWDLPYPYKGRRMPWPQDRHDPMHTNNYHWYDPLPQVPELGLSGLLCLIVLLSLGIAKGRRLRAGDRRQE